MKTYIKPSIKSRTVETERSILAASISTGISDDPAWEPALGKEQGAVSTEQATDGPGIWED